MCGCLCDWNWVLNALGLDLVEERPGRLCLSTQILAPAFDTSDLNCTSADFFAWLPRKHWCIEALKLGKGDPHLLKVTAPDSLAGRASNLRRIAIQGFASFNWTIALDAVGPMQQLEELEVLNYMMTEELAPKLAQLISDAAESMTRIDLSGSIIWSAEVDVIMRGITKCRKLKELKFCATFGSTGLADCLNLLQSAENVETLYVMEDSGDPDDPTFDVSATVQQNNEQVLAAVADLLRRTTCLKELRYQLYEQDALEGVFKALETNTTLERLVIIGYEFHLPRHDSRIGAMLKAMLAKNRVLRSLTFEECAVGLGAAVLVSEGLSENRALEIFDVSTCELDFPAVHALCNALKQNVTLRSLHVGSFSASLCERDRMSAELTRNGWYKRVEMPWEDRDVPGLQAALRDASLCPSNLCLATNSFSLESLATLCAALAASPGVRSLTVSLRNATIDHLAHLHVMLSMNTSLKSITIEDDFGENGSSALAALGLSRNECVTELTMKCSRGDAAIAEVISTMLKTNETLSKVLIRCTSCSVEPGFLRAVSDGVLENGFITDFSLYEGYCTYCPCEWIRAAVRRNARCLRRGASFALRPTLDKDCAEAFEQFESKPSFVPCIVATSGVSEAEAESAVRAARQFVKRNYLIINGVVRGSLECHAGSGMQIDQLNLDCWLAIARYLKVSDVFEDWRL